MKSQHAVDQLILERSSEWIETLKRGDPADQAAFSRWLLESKEHVRYFLLMTALDEELRHIDPERRIEVPRRAPELAPSADQDLAWAHLAARRGEAEGKRASRFHGRTLGWWSLSAAAAVLLAVWIGANVMSPPMRASEWKDYQTSLGQHSPILLPDGSHVWLNSRSRISMRLSASTREVRLQGGEALFKVVHDESRPFRVRAHEAVLVAEGTQFNVTLLDRKSIVSVVEGHVRVVRDTVVSRLRKKAGIPQSDSTLSAGQQARVDKGGNVKVETAADVREAVAWTTGRLKFTNAPLSEIVEQFNRYNRTQIRLIGQRVREERRSGQFDAGAPESLINLVTSENGWVAERAADGAIVIREPSGGSAEALPVPQ